MGWGIAKDVVLSALFIIGMIAGLHTLWMMLRRPKPRRSAVADNQPYEGFNEVRDRRRSKR